MKMGRDEKQYNFIDDRNEEYFLAERGAGLTGWKEGLCMKQSNEIRHQWKSHLWEILIFVKRLQGSINKYFGLPKSKIMRVKLLSISCHISELRTEEKRRY
jgi:hypothetical protein